MIKNKKINRQCLYTTKCLFTNMYAVYLWCVCIALCSYLYHIKTSAVEKMKNVTQIGATTSTVELAWDTVAEDDVEYQVYTSVDQKAWLLRGTTVQSTFVISDLATACKLYVKVQARTQNTVGATSQVVQVVTAPEAVTNVKQTDATYDRVYFTWNPLPRVDCYYIYSEYTKPIVLDNPKEAKTCIAGLSSNSLYTFYVAGAVISDNGYVATGQTMLRGGCSVETKTAPGKLTASEYKVSYEGGDSEIMITADPPSGANGTQIRFYIGKGKKEIGTYNQNVTFPASKYQNKFICFRARAYCYHHGRTYYGPWTRYRYFANMNIKTKCKKKIGTVTWKKVQGAKLYEVYLSKKQNRGFKRVATIKRNQLKLIRYGNIKFKKRQMCYIKIVPYFYSDEMYIPSDIAGYARVRIR